MRLGWVVVIAWAAACGHHGQRLRQRHDAAARGLALDDVVVEAAGGRRHGGIADRDQRALDEDRVLGVQHVHRLQAAFDKLVHARKLAWYRER